jgi:hypothetical protein
MRERASKPFGPRKCHFDAALGRAKGGAKGGQLWRKRWCRTGDASDGTDSTENEKASVEPEAFLLSASSGKFLKNYLVTPMGLEPMLPP